MLDALPTPKISRRLRAFRFLKIICPPLKFNNKRILIYAYIIDIFYH
ncbi:Hypothetical protein MCYN_0638 [Mycoplasmopsis cynos C142]|uniref:Uncharacterized protein n=1 Tax=Mycoplasmopsis cynos (strain C142) TaxID=1246955 RepID=L0RXX1_MYCC1|nr:Hypothetical protein MCYN_0638 [Mycoplasmopsis cynos C142]